MAVDDDMTSVWDAVERSTKWLDAHHAPNDAEITMRLLKLTEEAGEAAQAWIGATGRNPRKGVTHSRHDVAAELADVVFGALVTITSLGLDPAAVLADKARALIARTDEAGRDSRSAREHGAGPR
jgi:NTP pyrophosphatase (non-canonical NTP hydrolase)